MLNTKKISLAVGFVLISNASASQAITVGALADKNNELIELEADLAIAKKRADLAPYTAPKQAVQDVIKVKKSPTEEVDNVLMTSIFGDVQNPTAEFIQDGTSFTRRRGDMIGSWTVASIKDRQAILVKMPAETISQKKSKNKPVKEIQPITKVIYLTMKVAPQTYGQLQSQFVPAVNSMPSPLPSH